MHRNTYLLVSFLAVLAALVVGVNFGRRYAAPATVGQPSSPNLPIPTANQALSEYSNKHCGISFMYPSSFTKLESATGSAILVNPQNSDESIAIICQKEIPPPALPPEKIDSVQIGTVSAKLYHDASAKDGKPLEALIFRHPITGLDIFIAGYGSAFNDLLKSIQVLP